MKAILGFSLILGLIFNQAWSSEGRLLEQTAVIVEDSVILLSEIQQALEQNRQALLQKGLVVDEAQLKKQVVNQLILNQLIAAKEKQAHIQVDEAQVEAYIHKIADQNHVSLEVLKVQLGEAGYANLVKNIRSKLAFEKLKQQLIYPKIQVSDQEVQAALKRYKLTQFETKYHLWQIMLKLPFNAKQAQIDQVVARMDKLRSRLHNLAEFKKTAAAISQGPNALKGGELGWFSEDQLPSAFEKIVKAMEVGQMSQPIVSPVGVHVVYLQEKSRTLKKAQKITSAQMRQRLLQKKAQEAVELFLARLKDQAHIEIYWAEYPQDDQ